MKATGKKPRRAHASGLICERCGRPEAKNFCGRLLCPDCFQVMGSCCLEFGGDDLWRRAEQD